MAEESSIKNVLDSLNKINPSAGKSPGISKNRPTEDSESNSILGGLVKSASKALQGVGNNSSYTGSDSASTVTYNPTLEAAQNVDKINSAASDFQQSLQGVDKKVEKLYTKAADKQENTSDQLDSIRMSRYVDLLQTRQNVVNNLNGVNTRLQETAKKAEVDPDRIFKDPSTNGDPGQVSMSKKTLAAIGVALGAMGASLGGGQNYALQIVQTAIEQDIEAQKETYAQNMKALMLERQIALDELDAANIDLLAESMARQNIMTSTGAALGAVGSRESAVMSTPMFKEYVYKSVAGQADATSRVQEVWRGTLNSTNSLYLNALGDALAGTGVSPIGKGVGPAWQNIYGGAGRPGMTLGGPQAYGTDWESPK